MEKVKIAVIGFGHDHAVFILNSLRKQNSIFDVAGIYLPEEEERRFAHKLESVAEVPRLSLEQILNDPSIRAVAVESEEKRLTAFALAAAAHGKHIHLDKPGGPKPEEFEELVAACRAKHLILHMGYMYRYNPQIQKLVRDVKDGELGTVISVEAQMNCLHTPQKRQWLGGYPGGMMYFLGCHLVDLVLQLQGEPIQIFPFNRCTGTDQVTAADYAMAVFDYPRGISFVKSCANEIGGFARRQLVVTGTKKTVELKPLEMYEVLPEHYTQVTEYTRKAWNDSGRCFRSRQFDRYDAMLASFAEMVRGERENPWNYDYELLVYHTLMKCCGRDSM